MRDEPGTIRNWLEEKNPSCMRCVGSKLQGEIQLICNDLGMYSDLFPDLQTLAPKPQIVSAPQICSNVLHSLAVSHTKIGSVQVENPWSWLGTSGTRTAWMVGFNLIGSLAIRDEKGKSINYRKAIPFPMENPSFYW